MKNVMKFFTALLLALTTMPVVAEDFNFAATAGSPFLAQPADNNTVVTPTAATPSQSPTVLSSQTAAIISNGARNPKVATTQTTTATQTTQATPVKKKNALKRKGMSCASAQKHILVGTYNDNEECVVTKCTDGWETHDNKTCEKTNDHKNCKGTWIAGKCSCTYGKDSEGNCLSKQEQKTKKATAKAESAAEKNYNKDIDKIVDAYNTVAKKLYSKCVADGISIEDCE